MLTLAETLGAPDTLEVGPPDRLDGRLPNRSAAGHLALLHDGLTGSERGFRPALQRRPVAGQDGRCLVSRACEITFIRPLRPGRLAL